MKYYYFIALFFFATRLFSQNSGVNEDPDYFNCGKNNVTEALYEKYPAQRAIAELANAELEEFSRNYENSPLRDNDVIIIPIVFHIIHNNGSENISDAQVQSAIDVINADFKAQNSEVNSVVSHFQSRVANVNFEFRLARKDPNGNCTNGIVRTVSSSTYAGGENLKSISPSWGRNRYLNVWVCKTIESGSAGYAYLPSSVNGNFGQNVDGIVIADTYVGNIGTSSNYTSHALTHEIGHWANLEHTWGPSNNPGLATNCNGDDGVADTPNTIGWTSCQLGGTTCGSLDNVENFMDYSYCSKMFTTGQKNRMRAAMASPIAQRNQLSTPANLAFTGVSEPDIICLADFVTIGEVSICSNNEIQFQDVSYNGVTQWEWVFPGGNPSTSTSPSPTVFYDTPGTYSVTFTATNANSSATITKTDFINILPLAENTLPYTEGFETFNEMESNTENWKVVSPGGTNAEWEIKNGVGYEGEKSVYVNGYSNTAETIETLISPTFDLTGLSQNAVLTFRYAHAMRSANTQDKLMVYISRDCGETWNQRFTREGEDLATVSDYYTAAYTPASESDWSEVVITNITPMFFQEDFRFKFEFSSKSGNNIYIDNINLYDPNFTGVEGVNFLNYVDIFPNPANDQFTLNYSLKSYGNLKIDILDISGRKVKALFEGSKAAGEYTQKMEINSLSSGIYFVKIDFNGAQVTRKLVVNK